MELKARIGSAGARIAIVLSLALLAVPATAQDLGSVNPEPLPPLAKPDDPRTPERMADLPAGCRQLLVAP
jgi:hypothetical protein